MYNLDDESTKVTVNLESSDTGEATVSPSNLTFTVNNWETPQAVTVTGVNDSAKDSHQDYDISLSASKKITDNNYEVTTFAGSGSSGSTDGAATSARFSNPWGITTDGTNLYVADYSNHRIRKIVISTGVVSTLAGSSSGFADGTGTSAKFNSPFGITTDGTNLYVVDRSNHKIRKIVISSGAVTTLAGSSSGFADGTGTSARFSSPDGISTDGANLYVGDTSNHKIRKIVISTGAVTTLAGSTYGFANGTATSAKFNSPRGVVVAGSHLYVADHANKKDT